MYLLVGLGNFGKEYENTRHNYGFLLIDKIISRYNLDYFGKKFKSDCYQGTINEKKVFVIKPNTFMNLSGHALQEVIKFFKISLGEIIVFHDDLDIEIGRVKYKIGGGSGGHNGLKSIDENIGKDYARVRLGIGKPLDLRYEIAEYVLAKFSSDELKIVDKINQKIVDNILYLINGDSVNFLNKIYL
jgi:PTH1 family peptidyl-tRNA hydrolase